MLDAAQLAAEVRRLVLPPPPKLTVSQWADRFRMLSAEASGEPGQWRTERAPYQRGMMDALSDSQVGTLVAMCSAQIGKTEMVNNAVGFFIHQDPSPVMVVQPTIQMAEAWSKTRLAPMLRDTPVLRDRVADVKSRNSANTILDKTFPGGLLVIRGSNAPAGLASQPIRVVLCDEVDRFDESAGTEGDPVDLAFKRTTTFSGRRKHVLISTPGIKGHSRIEKAWMESDQRRYFVPCPHCGDMQHLQWGQVVWPEGQPEEAFYACRGCGGVITDAHKQAMLRGGEWRATGNFNGTAGFHLNELYSPWRRFGEIAADFVKAKRRGPESLKVWINTSLGETWDPREGEEAKVEGLLKRARQENYSSGMVPNGVAILTAGIDVQTSNPQRVEVVVRGTGVGFEQWTIQHLVIPGNLATAEPWDRLEDYLLQDFPREDGETMKIRAVAIDTGGHFRGEGLKFRKRQAMQGLVYPIKGASKYQRNIAVRAKTKYALWMLDTVQIKDHVYGNLTVETPGPRYQHFPNDLDQVYFDQLLGERPVHVAGRRGYEPYPKGRAVEVLDCTVYADAALHISGPWNLEDLAAWWDRKAQKTTENEGNMTEKDEKEHLSEAEEDPKSVINPEKIDPIPEEKQPMSARERYLAKIRAGRGTPQGPVEPVFGPLEW